MFNSAESVLGADLTAPVTERAVMLTDRAMRIPVPTFVFALAGVGGLYASLTLGLPTGALSVARGSPRRAASLALITMLALSISGCGSGGSSSSGADEGPLNVVATTPQVADIVKQVGGDAVKVTTLLPPGADPHYYKPKPRAISAIADAGVVFRSGGDLDAWLQPAVRAATPDSAPVDLSRAAVLVPGAETNAANAHWYLAPQNVARAAQRVRDELIKTDPSARETYRANAAAYLDEIDAVEARLLACSKRILQGDRSLMSGHDDFDYLAGAFGLEVAAKIAASGKSEPSASRLQEAVDAARDAQVRAVLTSSGESSQFDRQVAQKLSVPLLPLYADQLATGDDASTLLGAIAYDIEQLADAVTDGSVKCDVATAAAGRSASATSRASISRSRRSTST